MLSAAMRENSLLVHPLALIVSSNLMSARLPKLRIFTGSNC